MAERLHDCPGDCGRQVAYHLFACGDCWFRLPLELQRAIRRARRGTGAHLAAMGEACDWYRENTEVTR